MPHEMNTNNNMLEKIFYKWREDTMNTSSIWAWSDRYYFNIVRGILHFIWKKFVNIFALDCIHNKELERLSVD